MKKFVEILITHLTKLSPKFKGIHTIWKPIQLLERFYTEIELRDIEEFKGFLDDLYDFGVKIAENNQDQQPKYNIKTIEEFWKSWIHKTSSKNFILYYSLALSYVYSIIAFRIS